jgi:hypothetical protein
MPDSDDQFSDWTEDEEAYEYYYEEAPEDIDDDPYYFDEYDEEC